MREETKKTKKKFNKKYLAFGILGLFALALVAATVMPSLFNRQTTINAKQTLEGLGINVETVPCNAGEFCLGDLIKVSSTADRDRTIQVTTTDEDGIEVKYVGILELTKKNSDWLPIGDKIELTYTVVGEEFEFSEVPEGYTLIYYKDEYTVLGDRVANPQPAITVTSAIGNLPQFDDANIDDLANYCQDPDNYTHCKGAKLWVVPNGDLTGETLSWANMFNGYYYETDLVYYFANANGELIIPAGSFIEFYPQYTLSPMVEAGSYELTTEVIALN